MDKIIFHIDINSCYLSVEAAYRLQQGSTVDLRDIPSVVGGDEESRHGMFWLNPYLLRNIIYTSVNPCFRLEINALVS